MSFLSSSRPGLTRFAHRGSARLAYEPSGPAVDTAPAVVLLHDLLADRADLAGLRDALLGAGAPGYRTVIPEARGHGASAALANRRYAVADLAADVLAVLDTEGIEWTHLVGHGLGGTTALEVARRAPERVRSLVLIEPALPAMLTADPDQALRAAQAAARDTARAAAEAADRGQTDKALDTLLDARWGIGWRDRLPRPRLAAVRRHAGSLAALLTALNTYAPTAEDLRSVTVPALVVCGEAASMVDRVVCDRLTAWLPAARLASIPALAEPAASLAGAAGSALAALLVPFLAGDLPNTGHAPGRGVRGRGE